jgi:hypothetical protein
LFAIILGLRIWFRKKFDKLDFFKRFDEAVNRLEKGDEEPNDDNKEALLEKKKTNKDSKKKGKKKGSDDDEPS